MIPPTGARPAPTPPERLPEGVDLRLAVTDMDGTLLDGRGRVPADLGEVVARMRERGVLFAPASGRQLGNLRRVLGPLADDALLIAENGAYAVLGDRQIHDDVLGRDAAARVIGAVRELAGAGSDVGAVLACKHMARIERRDAPFVEQAATYYAQLEIVDDLLAAPLDDVLKVAVYDFDDAESGSAPPLTGALPDLQVVVSGRHWIDIMSARTSKGRALAAAQAHLGIAPAQTAVFGDYLNDLELYDRAELSFAMANAHPRVLARARYIAPANDEGGVTRMLRALLERMG